MSLAKELGKTLAELGHMTLAEERLWMAYVDWERKQIEQETQRGR